MTTTPQALRPYGVEHSRLYSHHPEETMELSDWKLLASIAAIVGGALVAFARYFTRLESKLDSIQGSVDTKLEATQTNFTTKLEAVQASLHSQIESLNQVFHQELDSLRSQVSSILRDTAVRLKVE